MATIIKNSQPRNIRRARPVRPARPVLVNRNNRGRYFLSLRSRHPSHRPLRRSVRVPVRTVLNLGSTTRPREGYLVLNSEEAVRNSASKVRMKNCFARNNVSTANYIHSADINEVRDWVRNNLPVVSKSEFGSRGRGNKKHNTIEEFNAWVQNKNLRNYIFENYKNFNREYRLHVTPLGCFYSCRKMIRRETPENQRWFRNDNNCVWILPENPQFERPVNWHEIEQGCVQALLAVGLDVGACDVRVQSAVDADGNRRRRCDFAIIEINSAPSFGQITLEKYREMLPELVNHKLQ